MCVLVEERKRDCSETFRTALSMFLVNNEQRRGHVEFIEAALNHLEAFGVHRDLKTYKALMDASNEEFASF